VALSGPSADGLTAGAVAEAVTARALRVAHARLPRLELALLHVVADLGGHVAGVIGLSSGNVDAHTRGVAPLARPAAIGIAADVVEAEAAAALAPHPASCAEALLALTRAVASFAGGVARIVGLAGGDVHARTRGGAVARLAGARAGRRAADAVDANAADALRVVPARGAVRLLAIAAPVAGLAAAHAHVIGLIRGHVRAGPDAAGHVAGHAARRARVVAADRIGALTGDAFAIGAAGRPLVFLARPHAVARARPYAGRGRVGIVLARRDIRADAGAARDIARLARRGAGALAALSVCAERA